MYILYIQKGCPYCDRVLAEMDSLSVMVEVRDKSISENLNDLLKHGGKAQVPFLLNTETGLGMYESKDIITFLKNGVDD